MRSRRLLRATAIALLTCFAVTATPAPSRSAESPPKAICIEGGQKCGLFFDYSTARRLYVDLRYTKATGATTSKRLNLCTEAQHLADQLSQVQQKKIEGLTKDKTEYRSEADRYKDLYTKADEARVKAENAAPSRLRWFTAGAVTVLAGLVAAFAATR